MSVYNLHAWCPQKQKRKSDSSGSRVTDVVNHHIGARNRTQVVCKSKNTQWLSQLASLGMAYSNQAEPGLASLAFLFAHYRGYRKCLFRDHNSWLSQRDWGVIWVWLGLF